MNNNSLPSYGEHNLNEAQIELAESYTGTLNPTYLSKARQLYLGGLSCDEIASRYPEYPLPMLYKACLEHRWEEARILENQRIAAASLSYSSAVQPKGLIFMNRVIDAIYLRYERRLLDFITNPDGCAFPQISKADFDQIERAIAIAREILGLHQKAKRDEVISAQGPLVNIVFKSKEPSVVEVDPNTVAEQLIAEMKATKGVK